MIRDLDEATFTGIMYSKLEPSGPVSTIEKLKGRDKKLEQIRVAFLSPGRQVFIYGDRGVGKTSLANTAGHQHHSSSSKPIELFCTSGFYQLMADLCRELETRTTTSKKTTYSIGIPKLASAETQVSSEYKPASNFASQNEAFAAIRERLSTRSDQPVVIFDEFDALPSPEDKKLFAQFVHQMSDQKLPMKVIYTGIGDSMDALLGAHGSAFRSLETIPLEKLDISGRQEIVKSCAEALGVEIERDTLLRIAMVSDGYPYYVQMIGERLFWEIFNNPDDVPVSRSLHYTEAIKAAVSSIQAFLKGAWDQATQKYGMNGESYKEILWAMADDPHLERSSMDIWESYLSVMQRLRKPPLERANFNSRLQRLKSPAHGPILKGTRQGWYRFSENIVRGYVRLKAEESGLQLEADHHLLKESKFIGVHN